MELIILGPLYFCVMLVANIPLRISHSKILLVSVPINIFSMLLVRVAKEKENSDTFLWMQPLKYLPDNFYTNVFSTFT